MHVVSVSRVSKAFEGRTLFTDVSFGLGTEDRVGVIGPNGSGKSTLLGIVAGSEPPDDGQVVHATNARVAVLPQQPQLSPERTALDVALDDPDRGVRQHEAEALLDRLSIAADLPVGRMSGGQRRRVSLAQVLLPDADLLALDEPTNHLDVDTIDWLEEELRRRNRGLLLVTHDRYFLERLTNRMLEIDPSSREGGSVYWHEGSYSDVLEARAERDRQRAATEQRRQNLLRKEIAWLRRGPKARTSKPKFRLEQAQALQDAAPEGEPPQLDLGTGRRRLGTHVLDLEGVSFAYGPTTVLDGVSVGIGPGDRVGVVGPNGSGKTTLLRVMTGQLGPDRGEVHLGQTVELGVYEQEARVPAVDTSVIETVREVGTAIPLANGQTLSAEKLAERFGFPPALQRASVAKLSGGERRRLALLHTLVRAPNVLVLDEPTNDLDLDTLALLEDHLDGFRGTLIVASHDRFLLDRLTDRILAVADGRVTEHLDWDGYREARRRAREARPATPPPTASGSAQENRRRQARRREIRSLEQRMEKLQALRAELHEAMAAVGADHERARTLDDAARAVETELAEVEERWLELSVD